MPTLWRFLLGAKEAVHRHRNSQPTIKLLSSEFSLVCLISWHKISSLSSILSIPCLMTDCMTEAAESSFKSSFKHFVMSWKRVGRTWWLNGSTTQHKPLLIAKLLVYCIFRCSKFMTGNNEMLRLCNNSYKME